MRHRTKSFNDFVDKGGSRYTETRYTNHPSWNSSSDVALLFSKDNFVSKTSDITDSTASYFPKRSRKPRTPKYIETLDLESGVTGSRSLKMVKECTHVKVETFYEKDVNIKTTQTNFAGNYTWENVVNSSYVFRSGCNVFPYFTAGNTDPFTAPSNGSGGSFATPDWFSLVDSFTELTEQFIPNQMLLGETIAEGSIYLDAIKAVISPGRAITSLLKNLASTKFSRRNLGEISKASKAIGKDLSSNYLGYHFAVKPAIDDIRAMLNAHKIVSKRLAWLSTNGGKWVPLRVSGKLPAMVPSIVVPTGANVGLFTHLVSKERKAIISAYCQIRESLQGDAAWQAYYQYFGLNKILGLAWELVPFSFILDWVTNAQEAINYFSRLSTGSPYMGMAALSSSIKDSTTTELRLKGGYVPWLGHYTSNIGATESMVIGRRVTSTYTRLPRIPTGGGVVDFSTLGSFHASIGGALVLQRAPSRVR